MLFFMLAHLDGFILATLLAKLELFLNFLDLFCVDFAIRYHLLSPFSCVSV